MEDLTPTQQEDFIKITANQWLFRGGTRGNAIPIVKIPLERMGTAFPLLSYGENAYNYTS